jgi:hypothetical protein
MDFLTTVKGADGNRGPALVSKPTYSLRRGTFFLLSGLPLQSEFGGRASFRAESGTAEWLARGERHAHA